MAAPATPRSPLRWLPIAAVRLLAPVAAGLSAYLLSASGLGVVAGCDDFGGFDCAGALSSRWSVVTGVPVSLLGLICYAAVAVAAWCVGRRPLGVDAAGWRVLELFTPVLFAAAAWFVALQATGAAPTCLYCLLVHGCGVVIGALILLHRRLAVGKSDRPQLLTVGAAPTAPADNAAGTPPPTLGLPTLAGLAGAATLVLLQLMILPPIKVVDAASLGSDFSFDLSGASMNEDDDATDEATDATLPESGPSDEPAPVKRVLRPRSGSRRIALLGGRVKLDTYETPLLGPPDAEHVIVELMNYGCDHCRRLHPALEEARGRYGDQLAIVVLPIPNEAACNSYVRRVNPKGRGTCNLTKLALAVSELAPDQFAAVHSYMLKGKRMPPFTRATLFAKQRVPSERLSDLLQSDRVLDRINQFATLYNGLRRVGVRGFPSLIVGDEILSTLDPTADSLCEALEARLGLRRDGPGG